MSCTINEPVTMQSVPLFSSKGLSNHTFAKAWGPQIKLALTKSGIQPRDDNADAYTKAQRHRVCHIEAHLQALKRGPDIGYEAQALSSHLCARHPHPIPFNNVHAYKCKKFFDEKNRRQVKTSACSFKTTQICADLACI